MNNHLLRPSIQTSSQEALGPKFNVIGQATPANAAWPYLSGAIFVPFTLVQPAQVRRLYVANGNVVNGSFDLGIYSADGTRITSVGSGVQTGVSLLQIPDITDIYLSPKQYYIAASFNSSSATTLRYNPSIILAQHFGVLKVLNGFPLPAVAVFTSVTAAYIPLIGMELMGIT